jgi:hypothetical protein
MSTTDKYFAFITALLFYCATFEQFWCTGTFSFHILATKSKSKILFQIMAFCADIKNANA